MNLIVERDSFQAVRDGDAVVLKYLIENGLSVNKSRWSGWTLLHRAAENGHTHIVEMLIEEGAHINSRSGWGRLSPLHLALSNGFLDTALALYNYGADPKIENKYFETPSNYARKKGHLSVAKQFDQFVYMAYLKETQSVSVIPSK